MKMVTKLWKLDEVVYLKTELEERELNISGTKVLSKTA